MCSLLSYREHSKLPINDFKLVLNEPFKIPFPKKKKRPGDEYNCVHIYKSGDNHQIELSYFVGVDWIGDDQAIYVEPKLNKKSELNPQSLIDCQQTDYLKMLFSALRHPEVSSHTDDLFEIKFDKEYIEISQQQDLLTPLLVVQFLKVVKEMVRKGLKKTYYKVEQNLYGKVKGKVLVGKSIKQNLFKNKPIYTYCSYDEFGLNGLENRLIKRALVFVQRYLPTLKIPHSSEYTTEVLNYIMPAFESVDAEVDLDEITATKSNAFYKEYDDGIRLAKLILKRFGYNITNASQQQKIKTPPFWIDMSKLFELYVLGLLKDRFNEDKVHYHYTSRWNELDFLLNSEAYQMVIDAKYKPQYLYKTENEDIRQVSGYARLKTVYEEFKKDLNEIIDCLIIYPDQDGGNESLLNVDLKELENKDFVQVFKIAVKLPEIKQNES